MEPFLFAVATGDPDGTFLPSLEALAAPARDGALSGALWSNDAVELTIKAMRATPIARRVQVAPPVPTVADAAATLGVLEHLLRPLAIDPPRVDLCHASSNGLSALIAMAAKWSRGTPFLLTEHGIYLRDRKSVV